MRLTCPNCGAQYEVPDEVIPTDGRDVQCSNCGDTWYQAHPDAAPEPDEAHHQDPPRDPQQNPPRDLQQDPQQDPGGSSDNLRAALTGEAPPAETPAETPAEPPVEPTAEPPAEPATESGADRPSPPQSEVPESVSNILREEAEREAQLRAAQAGDPLESQPDLGLDNMPGDETSKRARQASARMARMRGQSAGERVGDAQAGSRRELLPDIEEINSSLRNTPDGAGRQNAVGPVRVARGQQKKGGFARGFALIVILGVVMALVYVNAPRISAAVPQAAPTLNAYVSSINQARVWLDARLGELVARPEG